VPAGPVNHRNGCVSCVRMAHVLAVALTAGGLFVGTDVDDLIVLTVLFTSSRATGRPRAWHIWAGQYAGIAALVAVSALGAWGLTLVPDRWVGWLGLVPFTIGAVGLVRALRSSDDDEDQRPAVSGVWAVAAITVANGADNIAVYTPLFRTLGWADTVVAVAAFAVLVAAWCGAASWLGSHRAVVAVVDRYGHWLVPVVFMLLGAYIVVASWATG
jgi:cadmium resistance protein CadD (predicted permease)